MSLLKSKTCWSVIGNGSVNRQFLHPKNDRDAEISHHNFSLFPGEERVYCSVNAVLNQDNVVYYPVQYLDSVTTLGLPVHKIVLRVVALIMLNRKMNGLKLCNRTCFCICTLDGKKQQMKAVLFILCIPITLSNYHSSGTGRNLLFCDQHKSQGQTLSVAGLKLNEGCFFPESGWLTPWTSMHYKEKRLCITRLYIN